MKKLRAPTVTVTPSPTNPKADESPDDGISFLDSIGQDIYQSPRAIVILGKGGSGKSSLAAEFPNPVFIHDDQEQGIRDLRSAGLVPQSLPIARPVTSWLYLLAACAELVNGEHDYQTVVFEALTGFQRLCFTHCCEVEYDGDWSSRGFYSYQQGPKTAAKRYWPAFIAMLQRIRNRGCHVIVTGHIGVKSVRNVEGSDYDSSIVFAESEIWQATHVWAEAVIEMGMSVNINDKDIRKKASDCVRKIYMTMNPAHDAVKNRYGVQNDITLGDDYTPAKTYQHFCRASKLDPKTCYFL